MLTRNEKKGRETQICRSADKQLQYNLIIISSLLLRPYVVTHYTCSDKLDLGKKECMGNTKDIFDDPSATLSAAATKKVLETTPKSEKYSNNLAPSLEYAKKTR